MKSDMNKSFKSGLGFRREKGERGKFSAGRPAATIQAIPEGGLIANLHRQADIMLAASSRQSFEAAIRAGPQGAREVMQENYANQVKSQMRSQMMRGFKSGGIMESDQKRTTVTYLCTTPTGEEALRVSEVQSAPVTRVAETNKATVTPAATGEKKEGETAIAGKRRRVSLWDVPPTGK